MLVGVEKGAWGPLGGITAGRIMFVSLNRHRTDNSIPKGYDGQDSVGCSGHTIKHSGRKCELKSTECTLRAQAVMY